MEALCWRNFQESRANASVITRRAVITTCAAAATAIESVRASRAVSDMPGDITTDARPEKYAFRAGSPTHQVVVTTTSAVERDKGVAACQVPSQRRLQALNIRMFHSPVGLLSAPLT